MSERPGPPLQVLIPVPSEGPRIAGLPAAVRVAQYALALSPGHVFFSSPVSFFSKWRRHLRELGDKVSSLSPDAVRNALAGSGPLLVLSSEGIPETEALKAFLETAKKETKTTEWVHGTEGVAWYFPNGKDWDGTEGIKTKEGSPRVTTRGEEWLSVKNPSSIRRAEDRLFAALPQETDGFIARMDRKLSMAVSRILVKTPVTPNQITTFSLILGLWGSWMVAQGPYSMEVLGAILLWSCCIFDGCDGEVARLKYLCSPSGGLYDVIADNIVHVAIFIAIPVNVSRYHPEASFLLPGVLLVTGLLACMFSVWWLVLRRPKDERGAAGLLVERLASRDFLYLILLLAVIRRLDWFLIAAGIGSHLFNLGLWVFVRKSAGSKDPALARPFASGPRPKAGL